MTLSEKLYKLRRESGFSQESLAEKLDVSRQAVSKWERGESSPDTSNLIALASVYNISVDELADCIKGGSDDYEDEDSPNSISLRKSDYPEASVTGDDPRPARVSSSAESAGIAGGSFVRMIVPEKQSEEIYPQGHPMSKKNQTGSIPAPEPVRSAEPVRNIRTETAEKSVRQDMNDIRFKKTGTYQTNSPSPVNSAQQPQGTYQSADSRRKKSKAEQLLSPEVFKLYKRLMKFPYWALALLIFFFFGGVFGLWNYSWMIFLTIPLYYSLVRAVFFKDAYKFCYPVFAVISGLMTIFALEDFIGFHGDMPAMLMADWILTIPLYYTGIAASRHRKSKYFCFPVLAVMLMITFGELFNAYEAFIWLLALIPFFYFFTPQIDSAVFGKKP